MKSKRILRFYFNAEAAERAMNNSIMRCACLSAGAEGGGEYYANKIAELICAKYKLSQLWGYIDGVAAKLSAADLGTLENYAAMRTGLSRAGEGAKKEIKRALAKFSRRAAFINRYGEALKLVDGLYCLL